jgi:hypothetical protein
MTQWDDPAEYSDCSDLVNSVTIGCICPLARQRIILTPSVDPQPVARRA